MNLDSEQLSRVIEMAWEDRTPFDAIQRQLGLSESQVIRIMRRHLKPASFRHWRCRMQGRLTKHESLRQPGVSRGYCASQYKIRGNK